MPVVTERALKPPIDQCATRFDERHEGKTNGIMRDSPPALILDEFLPYRLSVTSNIVSAAIAREYRTRFGLRIPEWRVIAVLANGGEQSQLAIAGRTEMDKMTVSRAVRALAERGLIARSIDLKDERARLLRLTRAGEALFAEISPKALAIEARLKAALGEAEFAHLVSALAKLKSAAEAID